MAIRRSPEDFRVDERLDPAFAAGLAPARDATHGFAIVRLVKTSLTTPDAVTHLARALRVRPTEVAAAGLKDRHAVTAQHLSVAAPDAAAQQGLAQGLEGKGWRAQLVGWSDAAIDASRIDANEFDLVVRSLARRDAAQMVERAHALSPGDGTVRFANYFGDQRFGSARHHRGFAARSLLRGEFMEAVRLLVGTPARKDMGAARIFTRLCATKWGEWSALAAELPRRAERRPFEVLAAGGKESDAFLALPNFLQLMCIEAYQSLLWNDALRRMHASLGEPLLSTPDDFGALVFAAAARVPADWSGAQMPLPSPEMEPAAPWAEAMRDALAAEAVDAIDLRIPGLRRPFFGHALRPILATAQECRIDPPTADQTDAKRCAVRVRFALPRGAYATVMLRALGQ